MSADSQPPAVPRATYRLQLHPGFGFAATADVTDYLARLGVSHIYSSPYLTAREGSSHGYDITDHNRLNPELGGEAGFEHFVSVLRQHNMGHILDFVPNHMGVGGHDNRWWLDVLEWGEDSPYASYFDIDWHPANPSLAGKVLLPFLGAPYGDVLAGGDLKLAFTPGDGSLDVWFYEHRFPIALKHYGRLLAPALTQLRRQRGEGDATVTALDELISTAQQFTRRPQSSQARRGQRQRGLALKQRLAELAASDSGLVEAIQAAAARFNGTPGDLDSWEPLNRLLNRQHYRIAWWRVAGDEVNYRRFFDINDLAGLRMENPALFEEAHRLVLALIGAGKLDGLRLDHIDGLFDPAAYCRRLQARARQALGRSPGSRPNREAGEFYIVAEKILGPDEHLPGDWAVAGTTGYDFLNDVLGVLIDASADARLERLYRRFTGRTTRFDGELAAAKRRVMTTELAGEMEVLATDLWHIAAQGPRTRDYTLNGLRDALREVVIHLPVYRTYVTRNGASAADRSYIDRAVAAARAERPEIAPAIFEFIQQALTGDLARGKSRYNRKAVFAFAMKAQQFTGPVMAKGFEDTALYRYFRLLARNEVGGDPRKTGIGVADFHANNAARARNWPHTMLATATHDTKHGEDTRARLAVIAEWPGAWQAHVRLWQRLSADFRPAPQAPDDTDVYLIFQLLLAAWPLEGLANQDSIDSFRKRIEGFLVKALRESKRHTEWANPNTGYEEAALAFARQLLADTRPEGFRAQFEPVQAQVAFYGMLNGLAQTTLKLTSPGVPDIYQGCELWDLSLVDPDNRRPVDFADRRAKLAELEGAYRDGWPDSAVFDNMLRQWSDGRIKMLITWRLLQLRRQDPELFRDGAYVPLAATGAHSERVIGFARQRGRRWLVVVVPRLTAGLVAPEVLPLGRGVWADTAIARAGKNRGPRSLVDCVTGRRVSWGRDGLLVGEALARLPMAVLTAA